MNLAKASKFIDGVKNDEFRSVLARHYTPLSTNAPTPEELRLKSKGYLLLTPPLRLGYNKNIRAILTIYLLTRVTTGTNLGPTWARDVLVQIPVRQTIMYQHAQPTSRHEGNRL